MEIGEDHGERAPCTLVPESHKNDEENSSAVPHKSSSTTTKI